MMKSKIDSVVLEVTRKLGGCLNHLNRAIGFKTSVPVAGYGAFFTRPGGASVEELMGCIKVLDTAKCFCEQLRDQHTRNKTKENQVSSHKRLSRKADISILL